MKAENLNLSNLKEEFRVVTAIGNKIRFKNNTCTYGRYKGFITFFQFEGNELQMLNTQKKVVKVLIDVKGTAKICNLPYNER